MDSVVVDDAAPATPAGTSPRRAQWRQLAGLLTFGIAGATTRRGIAKGALALFCTGVVLWSLGLTGLWTVADPLGLRAAPRWIHLVTLATAALAVMLVRTRPAAALSIAGIAAVADFVLGGSLGVFLVIWELLFSVGMHGTARIRKVVNSVVGVVVALAVGGVSISELDAQIGVIIGLQLMALLILPLWWSATVRQKVELADLEARRAADLERIGELRRAEAVQSERSAIARDLHDVIASRLSTIAIQSAAALAAPAHDQSVSLRAVRGQALEALQEMRSMIVVLRSESHCPGHDHPAALSGGLDHIGDLIDAARATGMCIRLVLPTHLDDLAASVPVTISQACSRIVQEALANAAKHAPESDVSVALHGDRSELRVVVENSLTTASPVDHPSLSGGVGLATMRERAEAVGGRFTAAPDQTASVWRVEASLPVPGGLEEPGRYS
ncbi:sensor histidine kinase [Phytoactinopolyspora mesophila]|uniref:histidine kinase n=1 Tax=Phytoactinopolyspora mesophila TaxID=2650750 RepID=A0A7K3M904_9ACTN|nr:histidine kinase [Phytoactinopolyspora mesophila]NDL59422.1 hypothetical protein [Phytoactinopolyspora mesophila]